MNKGLLYGIAAYGLWGVLPIYWKAVHMATAAEIVSHRTVWSLVFVVALLALKRQWAWLGPALKNPRTLLIVLASGSILAANWLTYIYGVNAGFVVETSLGYFINPLVNVLLGVVFLREQLRPWQWAAVAVAAAGVLYLTLSYGALPWIALTLAFTFGFYGLLKKKVLLSALPGLSMETALMALPALGYLLYMETQGTGSFGHAGPAVTGLLAFTGVVTGVPLLLFAAAARRIPLSMLGVLQYIAPTLQLLIGVLMYGEPFTLTRMIGFGCIWTALLIYTAEGIWERRQRAAIKYAH